MFPWIVSTHSFMTLVNSSQYFLHKICAFLMYLLIQALELSVDDEALGVREQEALQDQIFENKDRGNHVEENKGRYQPVVLLKVVQQCELQCHEATKN